MHSRIVISGFLRFRGLPRYKIRRGSSQSIYRKLVRKRRHYRGCHWATPAALTSRQMLPFRPTLLFRSATTASHSQLNDGPRTR